MEIYMSRATNYVLRPTEWGHSGDRRAAAPRRKVNDPGG